MKPSFVVALVLAALPSFAAPPAPAKGGGSPEVQARALQKKAIEEDLLTTEFAAAKLKLEKAVALCAKSCPVPLKASLERDLGVVLIQGGLDKSAAVDAFVRAMKADATVALDRDTKTKEVEAVWNEAKKLAFAKHGSTNASEGDFIHTASVAQLVNTPMPLFVEYDGDDDLGRVLAKYKGFGMPEWKSLELRPMGEGYGATIPCKDVLEGPLVYFVTGFDKENTPVANAGDKQKPFIVRVRKEVAVGDRAHFPGAEPPAQCAEPTDCPPNFTGCKTAAPAADLGEVGDECDADDECRTGVCAKGVCATASSAAARGGSSSNAAPPERKGGARRWYVGLSGGMDVVFMPEAKNACLLTDAGKPLNTGIYCTSSGEDFPSRVVGAAYSNASVSPEGGGFPGKINPGTSFGTASANVHVDYALNDSILVGARLGWLFGGYTGKIGLEDGATLSAPIHAEARVTYFLPFFGAAPLASPFSVYVFGGAGVTQQAASVVTRVRSVPQTNDPTTEGSVSGWFLGGPYMVGLGAGARYAFDESVAIFAAPRLQFTFGQGSFGTAISPEVGVQYGF